MANVSQTLFVTPRKTIAYEQNNTKIEDLSNTGVERELRLRLKGQLTLSSANNTAAKTKRGDEWAVVKRIRVTVNGSNVVREYTGNQLFWYNYFKFGVAPNISVSLGDGSTANPSFDSTLIIPWGSVGTRKAMDSWLNAANLVDYKIEIEWGSHTDINADATGFTVAPTVVVSSYGATGLEATKFNTLVHKALTKTVTQDQSDFEINFAIGKAAVHYGYLINTTDDDVDVNTIINNIKLVSGTMTYINIPAVDVQRTNSLQRGLQRGFSGTAYDDLRVGNANSINGWYYLDLIPDGSKTEGIDLQGRADLKLELDVNVGSGATKITVIPEELIKIPA